MSASPSSFDARSSRSPTPPLRGNVYDVPLALDETLTHERGLEPERAKARNRELAAKAKEFMLGPMPVREFIQTFLPDPEEDGVEGMLSSRRAFRSVPSSATTPSGIYEPLLAALNKCTKNRSRCPGFVFRNASRHTPFPRKLGYMKPEICCYETENVHVVDDPAQWERRVELGYAEMFIEVRPDPSDDFFVDPPAPDGEDDPGSPGFFDDFVVELPVPHDFFAKHEGDPFSINRERALGQLVSYAVEVFARQHRVHLFTISVSGSRARLLRWDRTGCIVSSSFDIREEPEILCDFLWRFSQVLLPTRGHDVTVGTAFPEEEILFRETLKEYVRYQLRLDGDGAELDHALSEHYMPGHVSITLVLPRGAVLNDDNAHFFLFSRPVISPLELTGKCTRGFWAVDLCTHRVVFLKDTWRTFVMEEGDIIQELLRRGVDNVTSIVCHGDVPNLASSDEFRQERQCSLTDKLCASSWACHARGSKPKLKKLYHYRIVLGTVGYGLNRLRGTEELLHAAYDVLEAMLGARERGYRLHRDISIGNIILVREEGRDIRRGYLIDWDASCRVDDYGAAYYAGRTGTWLFMSINMLCPMPSEKYHTLQDDMESLLYVVLYCSFLWLPHGLSKEQLATIIREFFQCAEVWYDHTLMGGKGKVRNALDRCFTEAAGFGQDLKEWLDAVMKLRWPHGALAKPDEWTNSGHLVTFCAEFLQTHTLPNDDRVVHDRPRAIGTYGGDRPGSTEAISFHKRPFEEHVENSVPPLKKSRIARDAPSALVRRSERIRDRQGRVKPPAVSRRRQPPRSVRSHAHSTPPRTT